MEQWVEHLAPGREESTMRHLLLYHYWLLLQFTRPCPLGTGLMRVVDVRHSCMQRPVHPSFGRVKPVVDGKKYGWMSGWWMGKN